MISDLQDYLGKWTKIKMNLSNKKLKSIKSIKK